MNITQFILTFILVAPIVAILTYSNHDSIKSVIAPPESGHPLHCRYRRDLWHGEGFF